jgi:hypothetical protein
MRIDRKLTMKLFIFTVIFMFLGSMVLDAYARGRGRGGGGGGGRSRSANRNISRQGPARTGSMRSSDFSSRSNRSSYSGQRSSTQQRTRNVDKTQARQKAQDYRAANPDKARDFQDKRADNAKDFQEDRQDWKDQNREDWQDYGRNAREDRQDYYDNHGYHDYDDNWEWGDNVEYPYAAAAAIAVGTALTVSAFNSLTCTPTIVSVGGVSYYQCGSNWYNQAYQGGDVVYVSVGAPPGY